MRGSLEVLKIAGPISWAVKGTPEPAPRSPGCQPQRPSRARCSPCDKRSASFPSHRRAWGPAAHSQRRSEPSIPAGR